MHLLGFSTGALALGDFRRGIDLQRIPGVNAIELSALREPELPSLIAAMDNLDLTQFKYRSLHAPSALHDLTSSQLAARLQPVADAGVPIILHPDIIGENFEPWRRLGASILLENMDSRKPVCRTAREMSRYFEELPDARLCFDIGHAHQVDPTMSIAVDFMLRYRDRLAQLHISEVTWECKHTSISTTSAFAFHEISRLIPTDIPVIIESVIPENQVERELNIARRCLNWQLPLFPMDRIRSAIA